jgi:hypothetical protein
MAVVRWFQLTNLILPSGSHIHVTIINVLWYKVADFTAGHTCTFTPGNADLGQISESTIFETSANIVIPTSLVALAQRHHRGVVWKTIGKE